MCDENLYYYKFYNIKSISLILNINKRKTDE